ncbi:hypothetical protein [Croceicoccus marinus]|uniref:Uncharacterized protein n=1 Tax=Croceicoccus marinus TaxID=450378 RepID=A0A1Z1FH48_9SPHN|nr:hypothetical protein [Croceicoccus marinus]ARU18053.1 hypothetical protein A9D14_17290 [Croceicoccus marinus]QNE07558.1 hypothetical protein H4O24_17015 [Croceicoccus marinus]
MLWRFDRSNRQAVRPGRYEYSSIAGHYFLFGIVACPVQRAKLKDRDAARLDETRALRTRWRDAMPPYRDDSFTRGFHGDELAYHFGVQ